MTHSSSCGPKGPETRFAKIRLNLYAICIMGNEMEWNGINFVEMLFSDAYGGVCRCMVTNFGQYDDVNGCRTGGTHSLIYEVPPKLYVVRRGYFTFTLCKIGCFVLSFVIIYYVFSDSKRSTLRAYQFHFMDKFHFKSFAFVNSHLYVYMRFSLCTHT